MSELPWHRSCFLAGQNLVWIVFLTSSGLFTGCRPQSAVDSVKAKPTNTPVTTITSGATTDRVDVIPGMQASPLESTNILRSFSARGVIRELPAGGSTVVVKHEEIPGFMPKMTMEFDVRNKDELRGLAAGDTITFHVKATEKESWIEGLKKGSPTDPITPQSSGPSPAEILHVAKLKPGDLLPDAELLSEEGRTIHFSDFRGKALAFTFIFTRCPLPDFCPRMNQNFTQSRTALLQRTDAPSNWQFLSISFDPEFDKPGVLTRYAFSYRGAVTNQWLFAAAPTNVLSAMSSQLDFRLANEAGSFQHNLRTVVIDPQGRVYRQFDGNRWKAEDLTQSLIEAAQLKAR